MADNFTAILLLGPPGVGKGTQGKILGAVPGFFHAAAGDFFRSLESDSAIGREVQAALARGELVSDALAVRLFCGYIESRIAAGEYRPETDILVLDGMPRTVAQAELLADRFEVRKVLHLGCADEEQLVRRLRQRAAKQRRADDAAEHLIRRRFEIYRQQTEPLLEYYAADRIAEINALLSPLEVLDQILHVLIRAKELGPS